MGLVSTKIEILEPTDWAQVAPSQGVLISSAGGIRVRVVFMTKADWTEDNYRLDAPTTEFDTPLAPRVGVHLIFSPNPLPPGPVVVRAEEVTPGSPPAFLGLFCVSDLPESSIVRSDSRRSLRCQKIEFLTHDLNQPDCLRGAKLVKADLTDLDGILGDTALRALERSVLRPVEHHVLSDAQIAAESFWSEDGLNIESMLPRTSWSAPETYLLASPHGLANLSTGFTMPRATAIWADTFTSPWRDYCELVKTASNMVVVNGQLHIADVAVTDVATFPSTAYHFCPAYHYNYGHWMAEALTTLWLMRSQIEAGLITPIAPRLDKWQLESIAAIGIDPDRIKIFDNEYVKCSKVVTHSLFRITSGWDASLTKDQPGPRSRNDHLTTWGWGTSFKDMASDLKQRALGTSTVDAPERIFIDRGGLAHPRQMTNGVELATRLAAKGFAVVHPETLSIREQIALFSNAKVIIGLQGSGFVNTVFAPSGCHVIEIVPDHYLYEHFRWLAGLCGHRYSRFVVRGKHEPGGPLLGAKFEAPIDQLLALLDH